MNIFFIAAFDAPDGNCSGESRVLQDTLSNKSRNLARRGSIRKATFLKAMRLGKFALLVPTSEAVDFISADFTSADFISADSLPPIHFRRSCKTFISANEMNVL